MKCLKRTFEVNKEPDDAYDFAILHYSHSQKVLGVAMLAVKQPPDNAPDSDDDDEEDDKNSVKSKTSNPNRMRSRSRSPSAKRGEQMVNLAAMKELEDME